MNDPVWPSASLFTVVKSDATVFSPMVRQLYIGTAGDVSVVTEDDSVVLFKGCIAGSSIGPFFIKKVRSTGTTAADIVAFV